MLDVIKTGVGIVGINWVRRALLSLALLIVGQQSLAADARPYWVDRALMAQSQSDGGDDNFRFVEAPATNSPVIRPLKHISPDKVAIKEPSKDPRHTDPTSALYKLQIGDRLSVAIYGEPNTERDVTVDAAGTVTYPIIGTLDVVGKNIDEVRKEMNARIRKVYRYTFVSLSPVEFGGQSYTILGWVNVPGRKSLLGRETILSALCRAGGFPSGSFRTMTVDLADLSRAFLLRKGQYVSVDFKKLVVEGDTQHDVVIEPGDYIYVPSALEKEIYVMGEVALPSSLGYLNKVTLAESIALAGGMTFNASSRVLVVRGSLNEPYTFYIDLNLILRGCEPDFLLRPGDIVYVPPRTFTSFRELVQYAIRIYVSTAASDFGSIAWSNITGEAVTNTPVNVIPNINVNGIVQPPAPITSP